MSEPAPVGTSAPADQPAPYRPVSGLAIAGLIVSGLYAAWVAIAGVVAFSTQTPFLMSPMSFLLPLAGFGLSLAGRVQIRRSEGTRAGSPLATWGLWLSVLFGLGYGAYRGATEYALRLQATDFTGAWFLLLQGDDVDAHAAFSDTVEPLRRSYDLDNPALRQRLKDNPKDWNKVHTELRTSFFWEARQGGLQRGLLPRFFAHDLVETVRLAGADAQVEPQGVRSWEYVGGTAPSYRVEQSYRVKTPDGEFDVTVTLIGTDDKETGRRRWQVVMSETGIRGQRLTQRGLAVSKLRGDSRRYVAEWARKLAQGRLDEVYLDTCPPQERQAKRAGYLDHLVSALIGTPAAGTGPLLAAGATLVSLQENRTVFLPGYAKFLEGGLVRAQGIVTPDDKKMRGEARAELAAIFRGPERDSRVGIQLGERLASPYEISKDGTELRFTQPFELRLGTQFRYEGAVIVATNSPAAAAAVDGSSPQGPGALRFGGEGQNVSWWIAGLDLELAVPQPKGKE